MSNASILLKDKPSHWTRDYFLPIEHSFETENAEIIGASLNCVQKWIRYGFINGKSSESGFSPSDNLIDHLVILIEPISSMQKGEIPLCCTKLLSTILSSPHCLVVGEVLTSVLQSYICAHLLLRKAEHIDLSLHEFNTICCTLLRKSVFSLQPEIKLEKERNKREKKEIQEKPKEEENKLIVKETRIDDIIVKELSSDPTTASSTTTSRPLLKSVHFRTIKNVLDILCDCLLEESPDPPTSSSASPPSASSAGRDAAAPDPFITKKLLAIGAMSAIFASPLLSFFLLCDGEEEELEDASDASDAHASSANISSTSTSNTTTSTASAATATTISSSAPSSSLFYSPFASASASTEDTSVLHSITSSPFPSLVQTKILDAVILNAGVPDINILAHSVAIAANILIVSCTITQQQREHQRSLRYSMSQASQPPAPPLSVGSENSLHSANYTSPAVTSSMKSSGSVQNGALHQHSRTHVQGTLLTDAPTLAFREELTSVFVILEDILSTPGTTVDAEKATILATLVPLFARGDLLAAIFHECDCDLRQESHLEKILNGICRTVQNSVSQSAIAMADGSGGDSALCVDIEQWKTASGWRRSKELLEAEVEGNEAALKTIYLNTSAKGIISADRTTLCVATVTSEEQLASTALLCVCLFVQTVAHFCQRYSSSALLLAMERGMSLDTLPAPSLTQTEKTIEPRSAEVARSSFRSSFSTLSTASDVSLRASAMSQPLSPCQSDPSLLHSPPVLYSSSFTTRTLPQSPLFEPLSSNYNKPLLPPKQPGASHLSLSSSGYSSASPPHSRPFHHSQNSSQLSPMHPSTPFAFDSPRGQQEGLETMLPGAVSANSSVEIMRQKKKMIERCVVLFNMKPKKGIEFAIKNNLCSAENDEPINASTPSSVVTPNEAAVQTAEGSNGADNANGNSNANYNPQSADIPLTTPSPSPSPPANRPPAENEMSPALIKSVARFLFQTSGLSRTMVGEYIGQNDKFNIAVLREYVRNYNFSGLLVDEAMRKFLSTFHPPGESQQIYRVLEAFADEYHSQNPGEFPDADSAFLITYQSLMLHSLVHTKNKQVSEGGDGGSGGSSLPEYGGVTKQVFINQGQGMGKSDEWLGRLYDRILKTEIKVMDDDDERRRIAIEEEERRKQKEGKKGKKEVEKKRRERAEEGRQMRAKMMAERTRDMRRKEEERRRDRSQLADYQNSEDRYDDEEMEFDEDELDGTRSPSRTTTRMSAQPSSSSSSSSSSSFIGCVFTAEHARLMLEMTVWPTLTCFISALEAMKDDSSAAILLDAVCSLLRAVSVMEMELERDGLFNALTNFIGITSAASVDKPLQMKHVLAICCLAKMTLPFHPQSVQLNYSEGDIFVWMMSSHEKKTKKEKEKEKKEPNWAKIIFSEGMGSALGGIGDFLRVSNWKQVILIATQMRHLSYVVQGVSEKEIESAVQTIRRGGSDPIVLSVESPPANLSLLPSSLQSSGGTSVLASSSAAAPAASANASTMPSSSSSSFSSSSSSSTPPPASSSSSTSTNAPTIISSAITSNDKPDDGKIGDFTLTSNPSQSASSSSSLYSSDSLHPSSISQQMLRSRRSHSSPPLLLLRQTRRVRAAFTPGLSLLTSPLLCPVSLQSPLILRRPTFRFTSFCPPSAIDQMPSALAPAVSFSVESSSSQGTSYVPLQRSKYAVRNAIYIFHALGFSLDAFESFFATSSDLTPLALFHLVSALCEQAETNLNEHSFLYTLSSSPPPSQAASAALSVSASVPSSAFSPVLLVPLKLTTVPSFISPISSKATLSTSSSSSSTASIFSSPQFNPPATNHPSSPHSLSSTEMRLYAFFKLAHVSYANFTRPLFVWEVLFPLIAWHVEKVVFDGGNSNLAALSLGVLKMVVCALLLRKDLGTGRMTSPFNGDEVVTLEDEKKNNSESFGKSGAKSEDAKEMDNSNNKSSCDDKTDKQKEDDENEIDGGAEKEEEAAEHKDVPTSNDLLKEPSSAEEESDVYNGILPSPSASEPSPADSILPPNDKATPPTPALIECPSPSLNAFPLPSLPPRVQPPNNTHYLPVDFQVLLLLPFLSFSCVGASQFNTTSSSSSSAPSSSSSSASASSALTRSINSSFLSTPSTSLSSGSSYSSDVHMFLLSILGDIVITQPHTLTSGWSIVFSILSSLLCDPAVHYPAYLLLKQLVDVPLLPPSKPHSRKNSANLAVSDSGDEKSNYKAEEQHEAELPEVSGPAADTASSTSVSKATSDMPFGMVSAALTSPIISQSSPLSPSPAVSESMVNRRLSMNSAGTRSLTASLAANSTAAHAALAATSAPSITPVSPSLASSSSLFSFASTELFITSEPPPLSLSLYLPYTLNELLAALTDCALCASEEKVSLAAVKAIERIARVFGGKTAFDEEDQERRKKELAERRRKREIRLMRREEKGYANRKNNSLASEATLEERIDVTEGYRSGEEEQIGKEEEFEEEEEEEEDDDCILEEEEEKSNETNSKKLFTTDETILITSFVHSFTNTNFFFLWMPALTSLSFLCCQPRRDLHSAAHTSITMLMHSYGKYFSSAQWALIWRSILYPILHTVRIGITKQLIPVTTLSDDEFDSEDDENDSDEAEKEKEKRKENEEQVNEDQKSSKKQEPEAADRTETEVKLLEGEQQGSTLSEVKNTLSEAEKEEYERRGDFHCFMKDSLQLTTVLSKQKQQNVEQSRLRMSWLCGREMMELVDGDINVNDEQANSHQQQPQQVQQQMSSSFSSNPPSLYSSVIRQQPSQPIRKLQKQTPPKWWKEECISVYQNAINFFFTFFDKLCNGGEWRWRSYNFENEEADVLKVAEKRRESMIPTQLGSSRVFNRQSIQQTSVDDVRCDGVEDVFDAERFDAELTRLPRSREASRMVTVQHIKCEDSEIDLFPSHEEEVEMWRIVQLTGEGETQSHLPPPSPFRTARFGNSQNAVEGVVTSPTFTLYVFDQLLDLLVDIILNPTDKTGDSGISLLFKLLNHPLTPTYFNRQMWIRVARVCEFLFEKVLPYDLTLGRVTDRTISKYSKKFASSIEVSSSPLDPRTFLLSLKWKCKLLDELISNVCNLFNPQIFPVSAIPEDVGFTLLLQLSRTALFCNAFDGDYRLRSILEQRLVGVKRPSIFNLAQKATVRLMECCETLSLSSSQKQCPFTNQKESTEQVSKEKTSGIDTDGVSGESKVENDENNKTKSDSIVHVFNPKAGDELVSTPQQSQRAQRLLLLHAFYILADVAVLLSLFSRIDPSAQPCLPPSAPPPHAAENCDPRLPYVGGGMSGASVVTSYAALIVALEDNDISIQNVMASFGHCSFMEGSEECERSEQSVNHICYQSKLTSSEHSSNKHNYNTIKPIFTPTVCSAFNPKTAIDTIFESDEKTFYNIYPLAEAKTKPSSFQEVPQLIGTLELAKGLVDAARVARVGELQLYEGIVLKTLTFLRQVPGHNLARYSQFLIPLLLLHSSSPFATCRYSALSFLQQILPFCLSGLSMPMHPLLSVNDPISTMEGKRKKKEKNTRGKAIAIGIIKEDKRSSIGRVNFTGNEAEAEKEECLAQGANVKDDMNDDEDGLAEENENEEDFGILSSSTNQAESSLNETRLSSTHVVSSSLNISTSHVSSMIPVVIRSGPASHIHGDGAHGSYLQRDGSSLTPSSPRSESKVADGVEVIPNHKKPPPPPPPSQHMKTKISKTSTMFTVSDSSVGPSIPDQNVISSSNVMSPLTTNDNIASTSQ
eukprot:MONOS_5849.1-p1 / transcript=MONOS_5849.1 / gene=MONOS_5849 / organism=Monocercomonoides_exilis_PA203 / gene_product=guanine nucleotide exchange family protein / transcript_product=guanine nucleotide exchange family protein / location=Mono_scaffold00176:205-11597(-) / protein_length=3720 / sequence_SO=supercontig / SO=protein_coding / is_pseudo=false